MHQPANRIAISVLRRLARTRSLILGYHGVAKVAAREDMFRLLVAPAQFATHIELVRAAGFRFTTVADLADQLGQSGPPPGLAAVSFDDGLRDNYTTALPILRAYGIPATVYVSVGFIGGQNPWIGPGSPGQMLSEDEIRALVAEGCEIGAHTMTHADLSALDYARCKSEIDRSRDALEEITGQPIRTFAYPFGRYGPAAIAAARDAGFRAAVTTGSGSWSPFELTRAMMSAGDPLVVTLLKMADRYEPLFGTPAMRVVRQASKQIRIAIRGRSLGHDTSSAGPPAH
jgi:peptidoglycan/xylan/chitin deacetylase (PgdA/CDA1 family)